MCITIFAQKCQQNHENHTQCSGGDSDMAADEFYGCHHLTNLKKPHSIFFAGFTISLKCTRVWILMTQQQSEFSCFTLHSSASSRQVLHLQVQLTRYLSKGKLKARLYLSGRQFTLMYIHFLNEVGGHVQNYACIIWA